MNPSRWPRWASALRYFGGDAGSWLALQAGYDLKTLTTLKDIERRVPPREPQAA